MLSSLDKVLAPLGVVLTRTPMLTTVPLIVKAKALLKADEPELYLHTNPVISKGVTMQNAN